MPNHIDNTLTIIGSPSEVQRFVELAKQPTFYDTDEGAAGGKSLRFSAIVPLPADYEARSKKDGSGSTAIDMQRTAWGTKWGAYSIDGPDITETTATWTFQTAWGSPTVFIENASKRFPELMFIVSYGGEGPTRGRYVVLNAESTHVNHEDHTGIEVEANANGHKGEPDDPNEEWDEDANYSIYNAATHRFNKEHGLFIAEVIESPHHKAFAAAHRLGGHKAVGLLIDAGKETANA